MRLVLLLVVVALPICCLGFAPPSNRLLLKQPCTKRPSSFLKPYPSSTALGLFDLFRRNKDDDDEDKTKEEESKEEKQESKQPFFTRLLSDEEDNKEEETAVETVATVEEPAIVQEEKKVDANVEEVKAPPPPPEPEKLSPLEEAQALRAQAERMRLEAEKMDVQLTLEKIEKLEKQLSAPKQEPEKRQELQAEMEALQAKMRGEDPKPKTTTSVADSKATSIVDTRQTKPSKPEGWVSSTSSVAESKSSDQVGEFKGIMSERDGLLPFNETEFQSRLKQFEESPNFIKGTMANMVAVDYDDVKDINATQVALRLEQVERKDYSWMQNVPKPVFSKQVISEMEDSIRTIEDDKMKKEVYSDILLNEAGENTTALAILVLEDLYYDEVLSNKFVNKSFGVDLNIDDRWQRIFKGKDDYTPGQQTAEGLFPKSCRKQGEAPTEAQANVLSTQVLPKANFMPSSKPEPVVGGYIIRGVNKSKKDKDGLMEDIDALLEKSSIAEKVSVFYIKDFTVFGNSEDMDPLIGVDPVLLVTGPDVTRTKRPLLYSLCSVLALGTTWYLSIYPFLLNTEVVKKVDEQVQLANSGMPYNLEFLTDSSGLLFVSFLGIQLAHEIGHLIGASIHGTKLQVPTFVPSLITGVTSTVTTFKEPPKNHKAMFDFAVAGPLFGVVASLVALYIGLQLTVFTDAQAYAAFPALPLEVLRQSTLGGGIIELILGNGALSVPDAAVGTEAIAGIKIPLHPIAVAGYIGLMVNALSLLPVGTTDGGRISMTLFGRGIKLLIGQICIIALFFVGLFGSDLFLFYVSFLLFFQSGNELPSRNEVEDIDFGRVIVATAAGVVTLLTLIPMG